MKAPYPADTAAKGWRFELDHDRIEQSDTWALAAEVPMCQAALLMMWMVAWRQVPCASLPSDEDVLRSKLRIPPAQWTRMRPVLMRGWQLAEDGRLYHATLTRFVEEMLSKRRSDADRQAASRMRRERESQEGPKESRVTTPDSSVNPALTTDRGSLSTEERKTHAPPLTQTAGGRVCLLLRQAGVQDVNPGHPDLLALIAAGATDAEFIGAAQAAAGKGKGFAYALGTLKRQRTDAAATAAKLHNGALPAGPPVRQSAVERQIATMNALTGRSRQHAEHPDRSVSGAEVFDITARVVT